MLEAARGTQLLTVGDYSVRLDTSGHVVDKLGLQIPMNVALNKSAIAI
jgi:hypothetical protein